MRPFPTPHVAPLRCASWDSDNEVVVMFGGEGSHEGTLIYDPRVNRWSWPKPKDQPEFRSGGNMAYDAAHKLHILFGAQFSNDPHTWAYDVKANEWRDLKLATMPPTDKNDAVLTYDSINKVVLAIVKITEGSEENAKHRLETWAFDVGAITWTKLNPSREPDASGNRARNLMFAPELNLAILEDRPHPPGGLHEQQIWTYRYAEAKGSAPSPRPNPRPRIVEDVVVSVISAKQVEVTWPASTAKDVIGYQVERAPVEVLTEDQLKRLKRIPSSPQWVFAKEDGANCRLKWSANAEKGIKGYRIYRMNGRYDKDAIVRLTSEPISELSHIDQESGKDTRRYYVVAVDALGQEGFPSSPVWFEREWKRFYEPFAADWHQ